MPPVQSREGIRLKNSPTGHPLENLEKVLNNQLTKLITRVVNYINVSTPQPGLA